MFLVQIGEAGQAVSLFLSFGLFAGRLSLLLLGWKFLLIFQHTNKEDGPPALSLWRVNQLG